MKVLKEDPEVQSIRETSFAEYSAEEFYSGVYKTPYGPPTKNQMFLSHLAWCWQQLAYERAVKKRNSKANFIKNIAKGLGTFAALEKVPAPCDIWRTVYALSVMADHEKQLDRRSDQGRIVRSLAVRCVQIAPNAGVTKREARELVLIAIHEFCGDFCRVSSPATIKTWEMDKSSGKSPIDETITPLPPMDSREAFLGYIHILFRDVGAILGAGVD